MRKTNALLAALAMILTALLSSCTATATPDGTVSVQETEKHPEQISVEAQTDAPNEILPETQPIGGVLIPMDSVNSDSQSTPGGNVNTAPSFVNYEDLFSNRDLNQTPDLSGATTIIAENDSTYTISNAGIYILTGKATNYTIIVAADKESDKVQIVLNGAEIANDNFPVIYVKTADKCFVTSLGDNILSVTGQFVSDGDTKTDAVIFSKDDLTLNGTGNLTVLSAAGNGITCKDDMKITGGSYNITCAKDAVEANDSISVYQGTFVITTNKDGFHCENDDGDGPIYIRDGSFTITAKKDGIQATTILVVDGGEFRISASEGMEATYVQINGGIIYIDSNDDGINAARKSNNEYEVVIEINGGEITVVMASGDTDALDANGTIIVNGGILDLTGKSTFDADRGCTYNGGTIIINGVETNSIPASSMGGHGGNKGDWMPGNNGNTTGRH